MAIINIFYYLALTFIVGLALLLLIPLLPIQGNYRVLTVLSGSMAPAINTGSSVIVAGAKNYQVGDVITFSKDAKNKITITHRINEIKTIDGKTIYFTKGDANNSQDRESVLPESIIGKVWLAIPWLGFALETARKPWGFLALVIIPALIIIFDEIKNIIVELRKPKTNNV